MAPWALGAQGEGGSIRTLGRSLRGFPPSEHESRAGQAPARLVSIPAPTEACCLGEGLQMDLPQWGSTGIPNPLCKSVSREV